MNTQDLKGVLLGEKKLYPDVYDANLLQSIARSLSRSALVDKAFIGVDIWTAYELSWLDTSGKPVVAIAEFSVPAMSPNIIESKSFKYYLNSFNQMRYSGYREVSEILEKDLSCAAGAPVQVSLFNLEEFSTHKPVDCVGDCLDGLTLVDPAYKPSAALLNVTGERMDREQVWFSHLLKSNCPVTGQPDWASVWIGIKGVTLRPESLLSYIVSYRNHQDFHENCVERIYSDLMAVSRPESLWVYARYTRRGGLDINPFRSSIPMAVPNITGARQ